MPKLSVALITWNEETRIADCLKSVEFADEIVVVDSFSTDRTKELAEQSGARCYLRPFDNFSAQKNFAIEQTTGDWILLIDADERVSPALQSEIAQTIHQAEALEGYYLRRENYIFSGRMRYSASLQDRQLRLIKKNKGRFEGLIHERVRVDGAVGTLTHPLLHYSSQTLEDYFKRFNLYTSLEARQIFKRGIKPNAWHFFLKPAFQFFYFYIFRLGFLDGLRGLQYQLLSSFYTFVKYAKADELFRKPSSFSATPLPDALEEAGIASAENPSER